eukprot:m.25176 g.25176  ORF g.25176 m.25176 type:complete len:314 (-) comp14901_c0_seq1:303-1244(-)
MANSSSTFDAAPNLFFPAIVTPLTNDGDIDEESARALCVHMFNAGAGGLYVLGNTGEGLHLSESSRMKMATIAVEETKKASEKHVCMIHVGAAQPAESLRLGEHAKRIGASAVSSLPPFISHNSFGFTEKFYSDLATAVAPLPVIAYHIPVITGTNFSVDQLARLLDIDGVVGYKFTDMDLNKMDGLLARCPQAIIFHGISPIQTAALIYGARGGITGASNCLCTPLVKVHELVKAGKAPQAMMQYQRPFNRANDVLNSNGNKQVQGFKQLLQWQGVIKSVHCMARDPMTSEEIAGFRARCEADPLLSKSFLK